MESISPEQCPPAQAEHTEYLLYYLVEEYASSMLQVPVMENEPHRSPELRSSGTHSGTSSALLSRVTSAADPLRPDGPYNTDYRYRSRASQSPSSLPRDRPLKTASSAATQEWVATASSYDPLSQRPEKKQRLDWRQDTAGSEIFRRGFNADVQHEYAPNIYRRYFADSPQMSEFGEQGNRSPCANCAGSEDILNSVINCTIQLHTELGRHVPGKDTCRVLEGAAHEVTKQGLKHSLAWTVNEIRTATRDLRTVPLATSGVGRDAGLPSLPNLAEVVHPSSPLEMRRPSIHGQSSLVATPTNEIRQVSLYSEAARADISAHRTSDYAREQNQPPYDHTLPPLVPPHDMKRSQHYESGASGSAHSPHPSSGSSAFAPAHSPVQSQHAHRSLPSPPTSHFPQSGLPPPSHYSTVSPAAHASHLQDLQHQISTKTLALQTLQREHDQLLAAFSRSQIRCNTLDKKSQVSDHEINTLTEEKIRLQQQVDSLEAHVEELTKSRDEVHKQSTADGAQWRQIMAMSSQLQVKSAEEAKRYKTDRDAWEETRTSLEKRIEELESGNVANHSLQRLAENANLDSEDDPMNSGSVEILRHEVVRLRERCAELELVLQEITGETEQIEGALKLMMNIRQRVASKSRHEEGD